MTTWTSSPASSSPPTRWPPATSRPRRRSSWSSERGHVPHHDQMTPYIARTSVTTPQVNEAFGAWAYRSGGNRKVYSMVSDFGPAHDAEAAFPEPSRKPVGRSSGRCGSPWPTPTSRPSSSVPRISGPEAVYIWVPGGVQPAAIGKALADRGIDPGRRRSWGERPRRRPSRAWKKQIKTLSF